jgi:hypothetical protein
VRRVWVFLACAAVLAGCGGGGKHGVVTFGGDFPPATETVTHDPVECARDVLAYLAHSTHAAASRRWSAAHCARVSRRGSARRSSPSYRA